MRLDLKWDSTAAPCNATTESTGITSMSACKQQKKKKDPTTIDIY